ncbi:phage holin family protein [Kitasatospora phosalacinea]|uniref:phage holin family protein n=1 Tax=Kitasatospora phosalacinea TaxID=2065 RepID=UPI003650BE94
MDRTKGVLVAWAALAAAFLLSAWLLPGMSLYGGLRGLLWTTLLFSLVNLVLGGILRAAARPLVVFSLGLFLVVINMATLKTTALLTSDLEVHGLGTMLWASLVMSATTLATRLLHRHRTQPAQAAA